jgi:hypothetical protein
MPAEYLGAYLASRIGQNEIQRRVRGAVQMGLILPDLKKLPIVIPSDARRKAVVLAVQSAERNRERCRELIAEAEKLLIASIGLANLDLRESLFYAREFMDLKAAHRFGAEYFMPCKQLALDELTAKPGKLLGLHCESVREMFDPTDAWQGVQMRNFDLNHALDPVLDDRMAPMPAAEIGSMKKRLQAGDLVISRLRSYLREIALVRTSADVPAVGSSEFIVLRPRAAGEGNLTPETLLVFLRSLPVQTILKWSQDGSQHPRFNESDLLAIPVPDAVLAAAPLIDKLVHKALAARAEAAQLLEHAKAEVERPILGNAERV